MVFSQKRLNKMHTKFTNTKLLYLISKRHLLVLLNKCLINSSNTIKKQLFSI